jgi:hypothetical protein
VPLTDVEKVKVRHHTGYLNVQDAQTFVLGTPASVETQFIIEGAMNRVLEIALPEVRRHLQILDSIEEQMVEDHELLAVEALGEITVNTKEQDKLTRRYDYWVDSLCNLLGADRNPFDKRLNSGGAGINARVAT